MPTDNLPSNLYSGGAVVLNSNPSMEFYEQHLMRQQAKQDSLDQYYRSLDNKLDSVGMNPEDRQRLLQMENQKMDYYIQNRQKILNPRLDNGATQMGYQRLYGQMQNLVNESKDNWKNHQLVAGKLADAAQKGIMIPDGWMSDLHSDSKGVYNGYNRFDPTRLAELTATPDRAKLLQAYQKLPKEDVNYSQQALPNMQVADVTTKQWKPEQYDNALAMARSDVHTNQGAFTIAHQIASNPDDVKRYTDVYKQATGKDLQPGDLGGLYFGYALANGVDKEVTPGQPRDNRGAVLQAEHQNRMGEIKYRNDREDARSYRDIAARFQLKKDEAQEYTGHLYDAVGSYVDGLIQKGGSMQYRTSHTVKDATDGTNITGYELPLTETERNIFAYKDDKGKTLPINAMIPIKDGNFKAIVWERDEDGKPKLNPDGSKVVDQEHSRVMSRSDVENALVKGEFNSKNTADHLINQQRAAKGLPPITLPKSSKHSTTESGSIKVPVHTAPPPPADNNDPLGILK